MNGADFRPDEPHSFDLASCIGASWVFGGHADTLEALIRIVKPGGSVIVGEPYWLQEPSEDYLKASGVAREDFGSHFANAEAGERRGLDLIHTIVSSKDDWDRYEGLQWYATAEYARTHPDDPDLAEVVERVEKARATYLRWGAQHAWLGDLHVQSAHSSAFESYIDGLIGDKTGCDAISSLTCICP
jgi:SAM-dependent methyltransferase